MIDFVYGVVKGVSDETLAAVLVARLYPSRASFACVCDHKGPDEYATFRLGLFLKERERERVIINKSFIRATNRALFER